VYCILVCFFFFFFQAEDGIRDRNVTGVQTCALPIFMYIGDKENSNSDSALVSTKRSLIFNELNKSLYQKFFLTVEELQAAREGRSEERRVGKECRRGRERDE